MERACPSTNMEYARSLARGQGRPAFVLRQESDSPIHLLATTPR
jgi:hypothetical protein